MVINFLSIDIGIRMASRKSSVQDKSIHFRIQSPRGLLKAIERFLKVTNKAKVNLTVTRRLFHVDFILQIPMQKGKFDTHVMEFPMKRGYKGKNKVDGVHFGNMGKGLSIVNVVNLRESFSN